MDFSRHSRKTLYVVAGFYVLVGFVLAIASVVGGDRLGTFLGFLIISGALVGAAMLRAIMRLGEQADELARAIEDVRQAVLSAEASVREHIREMKDAASVQMIDLSTFGTGDPSVLTAATLDRDAYPRLMTTMEGAPAAPTVGSIADGAAPVAPALLGLHGPATKNLLRQWKVAVREGDLLECRRVLSTLVDVVTPAEFAPLEGQFAVLANRVESGLRKAFAAHVRNRDFAGALAVGSQIVELFPDRPVAQDFAAVKDQLERHLRSRAARSAIR